MDALSRKADLAIRTCPLICSSDCSSAVKGYLGTRGMGIICNEFTWQDVLISQVGYPVYQVVLWLVPNQAGLAVSASIMKAEISHYSIH